MKTLRRRLTAAILALVLVPLGAWAASNLTTSEENRLLDASIDSTFVALFTTDPGEAGGGTEVKTPGSSGYARVAFVGNAASGGTKENSGTLTFGPASDGTWAQVNFVAIMSASSGGTMRWYGPVAVPKTIGSGDSFVFAVGALDFSLE